MRELDPIAVVSGAIGYFAIGALWYSPLLFTDPWLAYVGLSFEEVQAHGLLPYPLAFLCALLVSGGLGWIIRATQMRGVVAGAVAGLAVSLTVAAAAAAPAYLFELRPAGLLAINLGYPVVGITVLGAFHGWWANRSGV